MAGLHIGDLPLPRRRFRLDRHIKSFETRAKSRREDRIRARLLAKHAQHGSAAHRRCLRRLWRKLKAAAPGAGKSTLASHVAWRRLRIRVIGHLWDLMVNSGYANPRTDWPDHAARLGPDPRRVDGGRPAQADGDPQGRSEPVRGGEGRRLPGVVHPRRVGRGQAAVPASCARGCRRGHGRCGPASEGAAKVRLAPPGAGFASSLEYAYRTSRCRTCPTRSAML